MDVSFNSVFILSHSGFTPEQSTCASACSQSYPELYNETVEYRVHHHCNDRLPGAPQLCPSRASGLYVLCLAMTFNSCLSCALCALPALRLVRTFKPPLPLVLSSAGASCWPILQSSFQVQESTSLWLWMRRWRLLSLPT